MANQESSNKGNGGKKLQRKKGVEAAKRPVSLSQLLLAPMDALAKAQVHAARSFLSFLLQLAYPHVPQEADKPKAPQSGPTPPTGGGQLPEASGTPPSDKPPEMFFVDFVLPKQEGQNGPRKVHVPALALVPINPLAVQEATFKLQMTVTHIGDHKQLPAAQRQLDGKVDPTRPWFLVDKPISIRGVLASPKSKQEAQEAAKIDLEVKLAPVPIPAGLSRLLAALSQTPIVEPDPTSSTPAAPTNPPPGGE